MKGVVRWVAASLIVGHGLIHLLGAAKGLGWAEVPALTQPVTTEAGAGWFAAAMLMIGAGVLLGRHVG